MSDGKSKKQQPWGKEYFLTAKKSLTSAENMVKDYPLSGKITCLNPFKLVETIGYLARNVSQLKDEEPSAEILLLIFGYLKEKKQTNPVIKGWLNESGAKLILQNLMGINTSRVTPEYFNSHWKEIPEERIRNVFLLDEKILRSALELSEQHTWVRLLSKRKGQEDGDNCSRLGETPWWVPKPALKNAEKPWEEQAIRKIAELLPGELVLDRTGKEEYSMPYGSITKLVERKDEVGKGEFFKKLLQALPKSKIKNNLFISKTVNDLMSVFRRGELTKEMKSDFLSHDPYVAMKGIILHTSLHNSNTFDAIRVGGFESAQEIDKSGWLMEMCEWCHQCSVEEWQEAKRSIDLFDAPVARLTWNTHQVNSAIRYQTPKEAFEDLFEKINTLRENRQLKSCHQMLEIKTKKARLL